MNPELVNHPDFQALRKVIQRLALVSHAPSQGYSLAPPPDDLVRPARWRLRDTRQPVPHLGAHQARGGDSSIPRGSIDFRGDMIPEYRQKSDRYFVIRTRRLNNTVQLRALLKEAEDALEAWMKTPRSDGAEQQPTPGSFYWKCDIADSDEPVWRLKDKHKVSPATIYRYRAKYRGLRVRPSAA